MRTPTKIALALGSCAVVIGGIAIASGGGDADTSPPATSVSERADLTSFKLVDHAADVGYGVHDWRADAELKNHSSKTSDYMINYEVIDTKTHKRVYNSTILVTDLKAGQTSTQTDVVLTPEKTPGSQLDLKVTKFDRMESF